MICKNFRCDNYIIKVNVLLIRAKRKVSGVTRVKNYGNGNFDIYLSKNTLNFIRGKGFKYGFTIVVNLIATAAGIPSMGVATAVITSAASTLVSLMI